MRAWPQVPLGPHTWALCSAVLSQCEQVAKLRAQARGGADGSLSAGRAGHGG